MALARPGTPSHRSVAVSDLAANLEEFLRIPQRVREVRLRSRNRPQNRALCTTFEITIGVAVCAPGKGVVGIPWCSSTTFARTQNSKNFEKKT
eukprot:3605884-Rhodomonas_salina.1